MKPYEIYFVRVAWRSSQDERPWVIIDSRGPDVFGCFPISGQCYSWHCFELSKDHPDFAATGLRKTSHIHYESIIELGADELQKGRPQGELTNNLLAEFLAEAGLA
jgi:hypothetical protein